MGEEREQTIIDQREVTFYDDALTAVKTTDGQIYVSMRHICDALGLNAQSQNRRINRHHVLSDGFMVAKMTTIKGDRPATWLRVDLIPLWLTGISIQSIKPELQPKITRFQREAAKVLWEAFQQGRLTGNSTLNDLLQSDTPAVQAYKAALAVVEIARQQVLLEAKLVEHERRLESLEAQLAIPDRYITPEQASQISQAVKAIALLLSKRSGSNQYGSVYGELYRRFGITSYKLLPVTRFEAAMHWLTDWHQTLTSDTPF